MEQLVVYIARRRAQCVSCLNPIRPGAFHVSFGANVRCIACAGLAHLMFVEPGDPALTRRSARESRTTAIVLRPNRRRNFDRAGILVERDALARARRSCMLDADVREEKREKSRERREQHDASFVLEFAAAIRAEFPSIPPGVDRAIAAHACVRGSRRVGRAAFAKSLDRNAIILAVRAHVRHRETPYDAMLADGAELWHARKTVQPAIDAVLARWRTEA